MITTYDVIQGTPEWLELRQGKYTGTSAEKLLKHGATSYALTEASDFSGNFHTQRGHTLEEEAIELYEAIRHVTVERPGFITNDQFPKCGYSPDGLLTDLLIEVKCFSEAKHMEVYRGDIPLKIMAQVQFGLLICELPRANLIIYHPKLEPKYALKIIDIKANKAAHNNFRRILNGN